MWLRCLFLDTAINGSNSGCISILCPWERHIVRLASVDSVVKSVPGLEHTCEWCLFSAMSSLEHLKINSFFINKWFQMMSGVPHHCHHLSFVLGHTFFIQFTKTELLICWRPSLKMHWCVFKKIKLATLWLSACFNVLVYNACLLNAVWCFI